METEKEGRKEKEMKGTKRKEKWIPVTRRWRERRLKRCGSRQ